MSRPRSSPTGPVTTAAAPVPVATASPTEPRDGFGDPPPDELRATVARAERSLVRALLRAGHSGGVPFDRAVGGTFDGATPLPPAAYAWAVDLLRHRGLITTAPPPPARRRRDSMPDLVDFLSGDTRLVPGVAARTGGQKLVRLDLGKMPPELRQQVLALPAVRQHQIEEVEPDEALMKALEPYLSPDPVPADAVAGVPHWDGESQLTVKGKTYTIGKRKRDLRTMLGRFQGTSPPWQPKVIFDNKRLADKPARRARAALRELGCPLRIYAQGSGVNIRWDCEPDAPSPNADTGVGEKKPAPKPRDTGGRKVNRPAAQRGQRARKP